MKIVIAGILKIPRLPRLYPSGLLKKTDGKKVITFILLQGQMAFLALKMEMSKMERAV